MTTSLLALATLAAMAAMAAPAQAGGVPKADRLALLDAAARMTNNELRYLHTTWWDATFHYETIGGLEAALPATPMVGESTVRPAAEGLYATATMLANGQYDQEAVGIAESEALRRVQAWSYALALSYEENDWGSGWQSALWVYYWAFGSKQVWASLPPVTRSGVTAAVTAEANRLLAIPPRFYRGADGTILSPGDTKLEEDAWNAALLYLAARMFGSDPHAAKWETQARRYLIAAYATPDQVGTDPRITGSNVEPDGTVINHGCINVDYFTCHAEFGQKIMIVARQTSSLPPWEMRNNLALIWRALTRLRFAEGTIYRKDERNRPTADVYYPQGYSFSPYRRFNLAQMDVEAFLQRIDRQAFDWASAHLEYTLAQQARHADGHTFAPGENLNANDEAFLATVGAEIVTRLQYR